MDCYIVKASPLDVELSASDSYEVGDLIETFVDDDGVTIYNVFLGQWNYNGGFYSFADDYGHYSVDVGDTSPFGINSSGTMCITGLPAGVDLNFTLYRNAWQVGGNVSKSSNISAIDCSTGFSGRTQWYQYGSDRSNMSTPIETTSSYNYWSDKVTSDTYYITMGVFQTVYFTITDTSKSGYLHLYFKCYNPSVSVSGYMTYEQYQDYCEEREEKAYQEEQLDTSKGILEQVTDFFADFWGNITDALASVFVPDEGYFEDYFNRLNDFFSEKLGMLYSPLDILFSVLDMFLSAESSSAIITFPEVKVQEYIIVEETPFDLGAIIEELGLQKYIHIATNFVLVGFVLVLLQNKLKEVLKV